MMKAMFKSTTILLFFLINVNSIKSQTVPASYVSGQLIVKFKAEKASKTNHLITQLNAQVIKSMPNDQVELWQLDNSKGKMDMEQLAESYANHPDFEYIEPNYLHTTSEVQEPNDPDFNQQWALHNTGESEGSVEDADIDAPEAWEIQSESPSIVVGIIDTGVDWRHPDLIDNIWQNLDEDIDGDGRVLEYDTLQQRWVFDPDDINGKDDNINAIDGIGNTYIDDFIGWNFVDDNNQPFDYEAAEDGHYVQSHGTHVAGIIGASGNNNTGVAGVTHEVQMALLKFLTDENEPKGTTWHAVQAINYAVNMGMQISNNSWGGGVPSDAISLAIQNANDNNHLFVTVAGNGGKDNKGDDISYANYYPANYGHRNIISVANSNYADVLSISSNYGSQDVSISAPGTDIYSCLPHNSVYYEAPYGKKSGTSMAAPFVTGACALLWQKQLDLIGSVKCQNVKQLVLDNVDVIPELNDKTISGGRLNVFKALTAALDTNYVFYRQRDSLALVAIYNALDGPNWGAYKDGIGEVWDIHNKPINEWAGIYLDGFGRVESLYLKFKNLNGSLPSEIGNLTGLTCLSINQGGANSNFREYTSAELEVHVIYPYINQIDSFNYSGGYQNISGSIPKEIGNLTKLKFLVLEALNLSGNIPKEIGNLKQLLVLELTGNQLTGTIPVELLSLNKLLTLWLSLNKLSGSLPAEISGLQNLSYLNLFYNQFSGEIPAGIGSLPLRGIDLGYNNFEGIIPTDLGTFPFLDRLLLDSNNLSGSIPANLGKLTNEHLKLNVSNNQLSGCYDPELLNMGSDIWNNCLDDELCIIFSNEQISKGNKFDASWEDFVNENIGSCWASEITKVWPGDLNNDGVVNNDDIVFYGLAKGNTGLTRERPKENNNGNINWEGQLCPDWDSKVHQVNGKHQDANGDGKVDTLDYIVVLDNMGLENQDHYKGSNNLSFTDDGFELTLVPIDGSFTGSKMEYDLYLKNIEGTADIYGFSSTIQFNRSLSSASSIDFTNSCLDTAHSYKNFDAEKGKLEFALTQVDTVNIDCDDALARVIVVIIEELNAGDDDFLTFKVNGISTQSNNSSGGDIYQPVGASAIASIGASAEEDLQVNVVASPQRCIFGGTATAYVSGGTPPYIYYWSNGKTTEEIEDLYAGQYNLAVSDNAGTEVKLLVEIENKIEYDENGEAINCGGNTRIDCVDNIDFDKYVTNEGNYQVEEGVYSAKKNIYTSGKILKNKEVDLQAGEKVSLNPGFTMEPNTRLSVIIEDCKEE